MRNLGLYGKGCMATRQVSVLDVGQSYFELHHQLHRLVDQTMSSAGLSLARCKVLIRLSDCGPMNQATLAGLLGFAPRSVTDTIDALERDGLVERTEDKADRRARIVALTAAGEDALAVARTARAEAMERIFGGLSAHERATFAALLTKISNNLPSGDRCCGNP
jgi:DNA-binding MarR family transcriptional regulator